MSVNLFVAAGYPLFSGVLGVGDWVKSPMAGRWDVRCWRSAAWCSTWRRCGSRSSSSRRLSVRAVQTRSVAACDSTLVPYVAGSLATTLGALLNPSGAVFIVMSAAAHFGGTSGLAWMAQLLGSSWLRPVRVDPVPIPRSWAWIGAAAVALFAHIAILGPGLTF